MNSSLKVILFLMLLATQDAWGQSPFQWKSEITSDITSDELVAVPLVSAVYNQIQPSMHDLRIQTTSGDPVSFLIRQQESFDDQKTRKEWTPRRFSLVPVEESGLRIEFELNENDPQPDGIRFITPLKNFEKNVQVYAIDSAGVESQIAQRTLIFDYSQFMDIRQIGIPLEETTARKFRVQVEGLTSQEESHLTILIRGVRGNQEVLTESISAIRARPFRINRIELWAEYEAAIRSTVTDQEYPARSQSVRVDDKSGNTILEIETSGEPIQSFRFQTASKNFQRKVRISVVHPSGNNERFEHVVTATIHHFDFRELQDEKLITSFASNRNRHFRIEIENGDNLPLDDVKVTPLGSVDELVFLTEADQSYQLLYGAGDANKPNLDTAAIQNALNKNITPVTAKLSEPVKVDPSDLAGKPIQFIDALNNPYLIGFTALLMIGIFACSLYRAAQKIDAIDHHNS